MDRLTAGWDRCFDLGSSLAFFPVRHHSAACSIHLMRALEQYQPDAILIEGPADTNHLVEQIGLPGNQAPICIYYSYHHNINGEEAYRSSSYYPLLDFSPELCAIRYGVEHGVQTKFIDLPYSELSLLERQNGPRQQGKPSYYDDYYIQRSRFIESLCEKQACRHYGELWEKLFEIEGLQKSTAEFVRSMLALCHYSRVEYPQALLQEEGCLLREQFMADEIRKATKNHQKTLVITGGFHTAALHGLVQQPGGPVTLSAGKSDAYLVAYSFTESDQLAGYASGMPYPAFYQSVFEKLSKQQPCPYDATVLEYLAVIGGALRKNNHSTSIADEIAASIQSQGLAGLRGKHQQGVYELLDGVRSAYIKSNINFSTSPTFRIVTELLRGNRMGVVAEGIEQVPLLLDFKETAKKCRLAINKVARHDITLDILTKESHRNTSIFFHRLQFLGTGFAEMRQGPSYRDHDTALIREKWSYGYSAKVESTLIDVSYLGGTVREAASTVLARKKQGHAGAGEFSRLLIDAVVMDLGEHIESLAGSIEQAVAEDGSFLSLAQALYNLIFLENAQWLLNVPGKLGGDGLLQAVYHKAAALVPVLETGVEQEERELAKALKDLYQVSHRIGYDPEVLYESLLALCIRSSPPPPPCLQGAAAGLLYAGGVFSTKDVMLHAGSYLSGTPEQMKRSGRFLEGVFLSAWDILFQGNGLVLGLSHVLETLKEEDFLTLLPDLRLAFTAFTPAQTDRIAGMAAGVIGVGKQSVLHGGVDERLFALGQKLDQYAGPILAGEGTTHG